MPRTQQGRVIRDACEKTVTVLVERFVRHPVYKKYIRRSKKYIVHDETNRCVLGQKVMIEECRPISKRKSWRIKEQSLGEET